MIDPEDKIAKLKEMEALLNQRKKEYEVAENLFNKGFRSEVKLSESRTNFEKALALYEKSQVELNNTKVIVPFDSLIEDSFVELGDYVKKGDPIAKIVDLDPIFISMNVTEKQINKLKENQIAEVFISGIKYNGVINYISKVADLQTRNFRVQVKVENSKTSIVSGLSAEVKVGMKKNQAFFIASSLISLDNQGIIGIKIIKNNKVNFIPIEILSDVGTGYWVTLKKNNGEKILIITQGSEYVMDQETVNFKIEKND